MESIVGILERTKILRAKEERIATLETENAILHIKIAQLQSSFKKLLSSSYDRQIKNDRCDKCKKCDYCKEKMFELHNQIKLLQKSLAQLQSQYSSYEQQLGSDLRTLSYIIPEVIQKSKQTSAETSALHTKYLREKTRREELHNALVELRGNIRVHCRIRPVLGFDKINTAECITCVDDETLKVQNVKHSSISGPTISEKTFEFERVHGPCDSQHDVFSQVKPLITSLLDGYNVCIMAYGQTGSGKSYTMLGEQSSIGSEKKLQLGIVPLAGQELFSLLKEKEIGSMYNVGVTVAEVYNEQIRDLLSQRQDSTKHEVVTGPGGSMEVTNLTLKPVETSSDLIATIHQGIERRAEDHTLIHDHSSRSHLIVTIHVRSMWSEGVSVASSSSSIALNTTITPVGSKESTLMVSPLGSPPHPKQNPLHSSSQIIVSSSASSLTVPPLYFSSSTSSLRGSQSSLYSPRDFHVKLQLVDLAGSECVGASGVSGDSLKEAQYINKSLSSLSDILNALAEKRSHIPYRNSVLTHLLQDTIGGDAKMVLMLCVSPTSQYTAESLHVLRFGARARQVQRANIVHKKKRIRDSQKSHH